jgi:hypothetical protein
MRDAVRVAALWCFVWVAGQPKPVAEPVDDAGVPAPAPAAAPAVPAPGAPAAGAAAAAAAAVAPVPSANAAPAVAGLEALDSLLDAYVARPTPGPLDSALEAYVGDVAPARAAVPAPSAHVASAVALAVADPASGRGPLLALLDTFVADAGCVEAALGCLVASMAPAHDDDDNAGPGLRAGEALVGCLPWAVRARALHPTSSRVQAGFASLMALLSRSSSHIAACAEVLSDVLAAAAPMEGAVDGDARASAALKYLRCLVQAGALRWAARAVRAAVGRRGL